MTVVRHPTLCSAALGLALLSPLALAGPAPTPGAVQDTLRRPPAAVPVTPPVVEQAKAAPAERPSGSERTVTVQRIEFTGNKVVSTTALQRQAADALGKALTIADLFDLADRLTEFCQDQGYGLCQVILPAQKVDSGTIRFEVVEGRIGQVLIEGHQAYDEGVIRRGLQGLDAGKVLRTEDLERELLLLNDRAGLDARAVIQPGAEYGTSDVVIKLTETPWEGGVAIDNYGREMLGERRLLADGAINSLTGRGDRLSGSLVYTEDGLLKYVAVGYGLPVGSRGASLNFSVNQAEYEVGGAAFAALGLSGENGNYRVDYALPLLRTRYANRVLTTGLVRSTAETVISSLSTRTATALNYGELALFMNEMQPSGAGWTLTSTWSGNLRSQDVSTTDTDGLNPSAMKGKVKFDGTWSQPFARNWLLQARGTLQWTAEALPDTQKFALGGPYVLRGYDSSEARGDKGYALALEVQRFARFGRTPYALSLFVDAGRVTTKDLLVIGAPVAGTSTSMESAGVGLQYNPGGRFNAQVQYAHPVGDYVSPVDNGGRLWVTLGSRF